MNIDNVKYLALVILAPWLFTVLVFVISMAILDMM